MNADPERGELREGEARYLLIRDDSLMGMFRRLPEPARGEALAALAASVAEHGGRSAAGYASPDPDALLAVVAAKASELGWGTWHFRREGAALLLAVENSPFARGHGPSAVPVCAPIAGMLEAVGRIALGVEVRSEEVSCAASGGASCTFRAQPR